MPGISFSPLQNPQTSQGPANTSGVSPLQDAIKLLSFKLPTSVGPTQPPLQGGPSALGPLLGNSVAQNWLMALFQGMQPQGASQATPAPLQPSAGSGAASPFTIPTATPATPAPLNLGGGSLSPNIGYGQPGTSGPVG